MDKVLFKKCAAEFIGTLLLVFIAVGTASTIGNTLGAALGFGLTLMFLIWIIGGISGCHINPAVSVAMLMSKKLSWKEFAFYVIAQVLGAIVGAFLLFCIFGVHSDFYGYGANFAGAGIGGGLVAENIQWYAYVIAIFAEIVLTFGFVFAILFITHREDTKKFAAPLIGFALALVHMVGIPITGTSVNPARSIGPAIFATFSGIGSTVPIIQIWIFIVGPIIGGLLAGWLAHCWFNKKKETKKSVPVTAHKAEAPKPGTASK